MAAHPSVNCRDSQGHVAEEVQTGDLDLLARDRDDRAFIARYDAVNATSPNEFLEVIRSSGRG